MEIYKRKTANGRGTAEDCGVRKEDYIYFTLQTREHFWELMMAHARSFCLCYFTADGKWAAVMGIYGMLLAELISFTLEI